MRKIFFLFVVVLFAQQANAQESTPYSRYGLGNVFDNNTAQSAQMGGLGAAFQSAEVVNYLNPASYAALRFSSFDAGFSGNFSRLKTSSLKAKQNSFSLNYLSLFFPINKYWTTGAALLPFSAKNYSISQTTAYDTATSARYEYEGSGTLYNLSWGNGFKYKGFSVGFNVGYLFGKLNNNTFASPFLNGAIDYNGYTTWSFTNTKVSSFIWNAGAQYNLSIKSKKDSTKIYNVVFGVSGSAPIKFAKSSYVDNAIYTFASSNLAARNTDAGLNDYINDYIVPQNIANSIDIDTLSENLNQRTNIKIPATLNIGIVASRGIKWRAGIDFKFQPWSKYKGYENNAASQLSNSWRIGFGGEFLPNDKNFSKFFSRLKYRAGFNYTRTNLTINNQAIKEFGINFGIGIPMAITVANDEGLLQKVFVYAFNVGLEAGARGTTQQNLVRENFFRLKFGVTLSDKWFVKRKYY